MPVGALQWVDFAMGSPRETNLEVFQTVITHFVSTKSRAYDIYGATFFDNA